MEGELPETLQPQCELGAFTDSLAHDFNMVARLWKHTT